MMRLSQLISFVEILLLVQGVHSFVPFHPSLVTRSVPSRTTTTALSGFGDLKGIVDFFNKKDPLAKLEQEPIQPKFDTVVIEPDFRCAALFLGAGVLLDTIPYINVTLGLFTTLLGILFLVQTFRIRFLFDESALELVTVSKSAGKGGDDDGQPQFQSSGENVIVGGANRWETKSIVNYDFFPKGWIDGPIGPILIYFKETQTSPEFWNDGPGQSANDPAKIAAGQAVAGQVHFFPAVCNAQQMRSEFERRGCGKL